MELESDTFYNCKLRTVDTLCMQLLHIDATVYITHPWADFPRSIYPQLEQCRSQTSRRWKALAESFPKTRRSVLAPSWLSSNRAWKAAAGGCYCVIYTVVHASIGEPFQLYCIKKIVAIPACCGRGMDTRSTYLVHFGGALDMRSN